MCFSGECGNSANGCECIFVFGSIFLLNLRIRIGRLAVAQPLPSAADQIDGWFRCGADVGHVVSGQITRAANHEALVALHGRAVHRSQVGVDPLRVLEDELPLDHLDALAVGTVVERIGAVHDLI